MWEWLSENSGPMQAVTSVVTALVWIFYLQILVSGFRRQRRTEILIYLAGSRNLDARTFVSNLGLEPIYILEIMLTVWSKDGQRETSIADRTELAKEDLQSPSGTTLQGPLNSGEFVDIGNLETILQRAQDNTFDELDFDNIERVEIKVAATTAASSHIVAARREFELHTDEQTNQICPKTLYAIQIRSWLGRYHLKRQMQKKLTNKAP